MARTTIRTEDVTDSEVTTAKMATDPTNASNLSSGDVPLAQLGNAPETDVTGINNDIALLGFKVAANGSLARYNLVDQSLDAFEDASGVDGSASTDDNRNVANYYSGALATNYWGDGSDGAVTITSDTNETVLNKNGSFDGDMLVKNYASLTIDVGQTLTIDQPARGMLIYVSGDCTLNGILSMTGRGALGDPTASGGSDSSAVSATGIRLPMKKSGSTDTLASADFAGCGDAAVAAVANHAAISSNGKIYTIARAGAAGGAAGSAGASNFKNDGSDGGVGESGGGGSGGGYAESSSIYIGGGVAGTCFSGGGGGGGSYRSSGGLTDATDATANGGAGGNAGGTVVYGIQGGGAGNPGGVGAGGDGGDGTGGLCFLLVGGNLTIGGSGGVAAGGVSGATSSTPGGAGGGSSGGGNVVVLYGGTLSNSGSVTADGATGGGSRPGGDGGDGSVVIEAVDGDTYANMTLISNAQTANDGAPDNGDLVITYTNGAGSAVANTNIKAYISRDGSAYTSAVTLVPQGTSGGHTILTANGVDLSGITSGTSMRWKIETLVQSSSMNTRIQAVSLGWS